MARYYRPARPTFVENTIYTPPLEMMAKTIAIKDSQIDQQLKTSDAYTALLESLKGLDWEQDKLNKFVGDLQSGVDDITSSILENPGNTSQHMLVQRDLRHKISKELKSGEVSGILNRYNSFQSYLQSDNWKEFQKKHPHLAAQALNVQMEDLKKRTAEDNMATFSGRLMNLEGPDLKYILETVQNIKANQTPEIIDGVKYYYFQNKQLSEDELMAAAMNMLQADPNFQPWNAQMTYLGMPGYDVPLMGALKEDGKSIYTQEEFDEIRKNEENLPEDEKTKFNYSLNPESAYTSFIRSSGMFNYRESEIKYRDDQFHLDRLAESQADRALKWKTHQDKKEFDTNKYLWDAYKNIFGDQYIIDVLTGVGGVGGFRLDFSSQKAQEILANSNSPTERAAAERYLKNISSQALESVGDIVINTEFGTKVNFHDIVSLSSNGLIDNTTIDAYFEQKMPTHMLPQVDPNNSQGKTIISYTNPITGEKMYFDKSEHAEFSKNKNNLKRRFKSDAKAYNNQYGKIDTEMGNKIIPVHQDAMTHEGSMIILNTLRNNPEQFDFYSHEQTGPIEMKKGKTLENSSIHYNLSGEEFNPSMQVFNGPDQRPGYSFTKNGVTYNAVPKSTNTEMINFARNVGVLYSKNGQNSQYALDVKNQTVNEISDVLTKSGTDYLNNNQVDLSVMIKYFDDKSGLQTGQEEISNLRIERIGNNSSEEQRFIRATGKKEFINPGNIIVRERGVSINLYKDLDSFYDSITRLYTDEKALPVISIK